MGGQLAGRVALVTGASRGIGRATALVFAREGAAVVVNYSKSGERARQVADEIRAAGGRAIAVRGDVARKDEVLAMVEETLRQFGRIDVLVNNAGVFHRGSLLAGAEEDLDAMLAVNVKGVLYCVRAVAPHMMARRYGKIVNISSIAALGTARPDTGPYAATKAAVVSLTKRLALELGPHGINVNGICPGLIRTEMVVSDGTPAAIEARLAALAELAMLGRVGEPEDIAWSALFLASDRASFITGQVLTVDGGRMDFLSQSG